MPSEELQRMTDTSLIGRAQTPVLEEGEDIALVQKAQHTPADFVHLYRKYALPIYRYLYSRTGNANDAEDLTSQVFLDALDHLARFNGNGNFAAWLFTIARRRSIDHYRRRKPQQELDEGLSEEGTQGSQLDTRFIETEELKILVEQVKQLDEREQELLRLRFAAGLSYPAMAKLLGRTPDSIRMALRRLLDHLEQLLEKDHD
jgi:RNA polymerase sigma-70 factor (ECF subfamily)